MPIQRRPPGSGKDGDKTENDNLSPLQRYLAKQREQEQKEEGASAPDEGTSKKGFFADLGVKASEMRSKVEKLANSATTSSSGPAVDAGAQPPVPDLDSPPIGGLPPNVPPQEPVGAGALSKREIAPILMRLIAYIIDLLILGAAAKAIDRFLFGPFRMLGGPDIYGLDESLYFVLYHSLAFLYYGWFYSQKGASPGKIICQLEVLDAHREVRLGYWRAFLRESIGKYVSVVPLMLGFVIAGFRQDQRSLHDLIFDTQVIRKRS